MRLFLLYPTLLAAALVWGGPSHAGGATDPDPASVVSAERAALDALFDELRREPNAAAAERIADRIRARWRDSGSPTGNLLLQWADEAVAAKKLALALDFLDQLTVLLPDYVEAWNRRATLHYLMGNYAKSMADINHVLALEPRHFGALSGMAAILEQEGEDELALRAWEEMLAVYPSSREAQAKAGELADKLAGSRT